MCGQWLCAGQFVCCFERWHAGGSWDLFHAARPHIALRGLNPKSLSCLRAARPGQESCSWFWSPSSSCSPNSYIRQLLAPSPLSPSFFFFCDVLPLVDDFIQNVACSRVSSRYNLVYNASLYSQIYIPLTPLHAPRQVHIRFDRHYHVPRPFRDPDYVPLPRMYH